MANAPFRVLLCAVAVLAAAIAVVPHSAKAEIVSQQKICTVDPSAAQAVALAAKAVKRLKDLKKSTRNFLLSNLIEGLLQFAEWVLTLDPCTPKQEPPPPVPTQPEANQFERQLSDIKEALAAEKEELRQLRIELLQALKQLEKARRQQQTCGVGRSRRSDGTCHDHSAD
jgi:hypothetical protein